MSPFAVVGVVVIVGALIILAVDFWQIRRQRKRDDEFMANAVQAFEDGKVIADMEKHWNESDGRDR